MASLSSLMSEETQPVIEAVTSEPLTDKPLGLSAEVPNVCTYRPNENAVLFISEGENNSDSLSQDHNLRVDTIGEAQLMENSVHKSNFSDNDISRNQSLAAGEYEASVSGIQLDGPISLSSHSSYTHSQVSLDDLGSNEDLHHLSLSNYGPKSMEELNRLIMDSPDDDDSDSHSSLNLGVESINFLKQRIRSGEDKICEMEEIISK